MREGPSEQSRVVVVGASAAGMRCACRLSRLRPAWSITVVEQRSVFSYAACGLPYVLSGDLASTEPLRRTADGAMRDADFFAKVKGVKVLSGWRAASVDARGRTLRIESGDRKDDLTWDHLVLATGARPRRLRNQPQHPRLHALHSIDDLAPLREGLQKAAIERAVVVGAGLLGCELAEALRALWDIQVTLVEAAPHPLPQIADAEIGGLVAATLTRHGVDLLCGVPIERLRANDNGVSVEVGGRLIEADMAIVAIGLEPVVELARQAGATIGPTGAVAVDDRLATSVPCVWAAGDCAEVNHAVTGRPAYLPLGSLANRQGRTLANVLAGQDDRFPAVAGAAAVKVFDLNVAATGITRTAALALEKDARSVWVPARDTADYWPEAKDIAVQLVYEAGSHRLLGVQVAGEGEVAKRADVATQLLTGGATLKDVAQLEHAYAPPYAPALDPLAVAAMVAENLELEGLVARSPIGPLEGQRLLDVRHDEECKARPFPGTDVLEVPLEALRDRFAELPSGPWLVVCARGGRSSEAARWLRAKGVDAEYLGGGLRWRTLAKN